MVEQLPFFLARAREWWVAADRLRARVPDGDPVLTVWREAAWAHLLLTKGRFGAAAKRLREVFRAVTAVDPPSLVPPPRCEDDVLAVAADLFAHLRSIVSARHPAAFDRPVAA
jgi:hypothetical protein